MDIKESSLTSTAHSSTIFSTLFQNMFDSVVIYNYETETIKDCNQSILKLLGFSKDELLEMNRFDMMPQYSSLYPHIDIHEIIRTDHRKKVLDGESICIEGELVKKGGGSIFAHFNIVPTGQEEGDAFVILHDVTEKHFAQKKFKRLYNEQKQILNSMPLQFGQKDLKNNFVKGNDALKRALGVPSEEIEGRNLAEFMSAEDAKKAQLEDLQIASTKQPILGITTLVKNKEGKSTWSKVDKLPIFDNKGNVVGIQIHVVDVTDLIEINRKVIESEKNNNALFDNAFDGIMIYDCSLNKSIRCNLRLANYLNTETRTIIATSLAEFSPEYQSNGLKSNQTFEQIIDKTKKRGTYETEWNFSAKNGEQLTCELISFLVPQEDTCQIMFVFKDITERKEQDGIIKKNVVELNLKNAELTKYIESNNQLENFAAIASHDMQAPLRTIHSYTELLQRSLKGDTTPAQKEYMHFITSATRNMRHLIQDLRAFSKVDSTKLNIRSINIDFMVTEVLKELKASIDYQGAEIIITDKLPVVDGDRIKLKQLFQNLITNALKYVAKDVIPKIEISFEERAADFLFKIKDNGIGIKEKDQQRIFQLFERLHQMSQYTGTGIGLSLCRKVVEQHFGEIGVESNEGEGSTFYFSISKEVSKKIKEII